MFVARRGRKRKRRRRRRSRRRTESANGTWQLAMVRQADRQKKGKGAEMASIVIRRARQFDKVQSWLQQLCPQQPVAKPSPAPSASYCAALRLGPLPLPLPFLAPTSTPPLCLVAPLLARRPLPAFAARDLIGTRPHARTLLSAAVRARSPLCRAPDTAPWTTANVPKRSAALGTRSLG